ncbi:MAG TPA: hypothetical protein VH518_02230 [Tepidisphaeraceae bacterium]|jgi:hypothetical protein
MRRELSWLGIGLISAVITCSASAGPVATKAPNISADDASEPQQVHSVDPDPICVARDGESWVACRYSIQDQKWDTWPSPPAAMPDAKPLNACGPQAAVVLDPSQKYAGWIFDLPNRTWKAVPASPVLGPSATQDPITVTFVHNRLIVWGMTKDAPHGAVLDTSKMEWSAMPEAPVALRYRCPNAVIGDKLIVWGGYPNFLQDGAVFDTKQNKWSKMADSPVQFRYGMAWGVWRNKFVIFGGQGPRRQPIPDGAIYDPVTDKWEGIAPAPFDVGVQSAFAVHGDQMFVWSGLRRVRDAGGVYNFETQKWDELPAAPISGRTLGFAQSVADQIIVWGGWDAGWGRFGMPQGPGTFCRDGASYDLKTGQWQRIPDLPVDIPSQLHPGW